LHDHGRSYFGLATVGEGEINDDNIAAFGHAVLPYFCW
jgi:hypothetical protein